MLHALGNIRCADRECTLEDAGERQHIVDLIREVAAAGADHECARFLGQVRHDLRCRICHCKDKRLVVHGFYHFRCDKIRLGHADKDVCAFHRICKATVNLLLVCTLGERGQCLGGELVALADDALGIEHKNILHADGKQHFCNRNTCCACAVDDDLQIAELLAGQLGCVHDSSGCNDSRAVLVVMEHRNIDHCFQLALDLKAARCGDILQVDAAEAACNQGNGLAEFFRILGVNAKRNGLYAAKLREQCAFAFHNRHGRERADVTEAEHCGAVRDDRNEICSAGQIIGQRRIFLDLQTGTRNTRRICHRKSIFVLDCDLGTDFELAAPFLMRSKCFLHNIHFETFLSFLGITLL